MDLRVSKNNHPIASETRSLVSMRYKTITKAVNRAFWDSSSETAHSRYVGSYGRGTAINTSDLDILLELPSSEYNHFSSMHGNGPSRLLQAVRDAILTTYPNTNVRADGQVVVILFSDEMKFEVLPAFQRFDGTYLYPDTNMGGNWLSTNPIAEQETMKQKDDASNGLFFDTCKHIRYIRDIFFSSYKLPGILIDSFTFKAIDNWHWCQPGESSSTPGSYEQKLLSEYNLFPPVLNAPGSNNPVNLGYWDILGKALNKMVQS